MAFARPSTPSTSPRKRAPLVSSRPGSPIKAGTTLPANNPATGAPSSRPTSRTSHVPVPRPSVSSSSLRSNASATSALPPTRAGGRTTRSSVTSSLNASVSYQDSLDRVTANSQTAMISNMARRESDVPRRKAGFGPPSTPSRSATISVPVCEVDEQGLDTELDSMTVPAQRGSSEEIDSGDSTETEEEDKDGKQENVVVCLRVRPPKATSPTFQAAPIYDYSPAESTLFLTSSHPTLLKRFGSSTNVARALSEEYEFRFDLLHVHPHPTEHLYDKKIRPVVKAALGGFNGTVFAYGQTASGKTHTMLGSPSEPGIIPLAIDELFSHIHHQQSRRSYSLRVSFLEIYNEQLRDLLAPSPSPFAAQPVRGPEIVENGMVKNLEERAVSLPEEVLEVLKEGETRRRVGATDWNERSSRSHCVFIVTIESMNKSDGSARTSKLNLIDLAGSESATGQEERRKEGAFINKSLLTLGTVIGKLTDPSTSAAHIPYRDSKLTRLLQPALSGNSRVAVVCTVSPDLEQATETLSTLKFAKRAKMVVTKAERSALVSDAAMLKRYAAQIASLQGQISTLESNALASERDQAFARLTEAERLGRERQDALEEKERELERLRELLNETRRFVLTGPELERTARRVSGQHLTTNEEIGVVLSPSRSRSLRGTGWTVGARSDSIDEMGALGLGTPKSMSRNRLQGGRVSAAARLAEEDEAREKEATLTRQLAEAHAQLEVASATSQEAATLRARIGQLESAAALAASDHDRLQREQQDRIVNLQASVDRLEADLQLLAVERASLREELQTLQESAQQAEEARAVEAADLQRELVQAQQLAEGAQGSAAAALATAQESLHERDVEIAELKQSAVSLEQRLDAKSAELRSSATDHEAAVVALRTEAATIETALNHVIAAREAALLAAQEQMAAIRVERDAALKSVEAAEARVAGVEELLSLQQQQHDAAEQQTTREKEAALASMQAALDRAEADAQAKTELAEQLQRAFDRFERLEAQRQTYDRNQRAGTDILKSRLAALNARTSHPATPLARSDSAASTVSSGSAGGSSTEQHVEAQIRNAELSSRVLELEKQVEQVEVQSAQTALEREEERELQSRKLTEADARAEEWRQKYLAVQRLLDQLMAAQQASDDENRRPGSETASPRPSTVARRAPLLNSQSPSRPSFASTSSPSYVGTVGASWIEKNRPPPLPYSPHQRERERKARRETIARDLAALKEKQVVGDKRDGWDSPQTSPSKY